MGIRVGVDVGGTFTDFLVIDDRGEARVFKTLSTPDDPSRALLQGLVEIAESYALSVEALAGKIDTIVHGTTVTTNAVLTRGGAKSGLVTTQGVRDALEMRRGIREEQYNNRFTNVEPLVPRYLRAPVRERVDRDGVELAPLTEADVLAAAELFAKEGVSAVAVCFLNAFANPEHERQAEALLRKKLPGAYLSVSSTLLPAIRFYDRISTTVLNGYVGPKLRSYIDALLEKLASVKFKGVLLIMQSNGGTVAPEIVRERAAMTLLSGPAAGPRAGMFYASIHGLKNCITVDMGGTSFDAAMLRDGEPLFVTEGEIDRLRLALPMLDITTIGAGGGSIGWIDKGGLLRMGPQSAGAMPGPVCYGRGGVEPTCTDVDVVLGYLPPDEFAGGRIKLDVERARAAIEARIGKPLRMTVEQAAVGMARVIDANMAAGVRAVTVKRGYDPREFPLVVAGGAGPQHCCAICTELEIPLFLVPRQSSIFCAAGMLMSDLVHDDVRSVPGLLADAAPKLDAAVKEMIAAARATLKAEHVAEADMQFLPSLDMRYVKQYHEVNVGFPVGASQKVAGSFHAEHDRLYGYNLAEQKTPLEVINLRLRAVGVMKKPTFPDSPRKGGDAAGAKKGTRRAWVPEHQAFEEVPVYDADKLLHGMRLDGPASIDQANTSLFLSAAYSLVCDRYGNYLGYRRDRLDALPQSVRALTDQKVAS
ncbi:MAG: hydantoinase/oxoprolinase family protein [Deltaproteobacteria bacterium]|nr:hydantoinase/oxoprolinase family protein [Deltaproteobacteria bacterium]